MFSSRRAREIFTRVMDVGRFKFIFHGRLLLTVSVWAAVRSFNLIEFAPEIRRFEVNDRPRGSRGRNERYVGIHISACRQMRVDSMPFFPSIGYVARRHESYRNFATIWRPLQHPKGATSILGTPRFSRLHKYRGRNYRLTYCYFSFSSRRF